MMDFYSGTGAAPDGEKEVKSPILTDAVFAAQTSPDKYRLVGVEDGDDQAGERVVRAINTALALQMPLLVSGEPGSGKTQLGYAIAHELGKPAPMKFVTKSISTAQDLFYTYDAVRHFQVTQTLGGADAASETVTDVRNFLDLAPLGLAILLALPLDQRRAFLPPDFETVEPANPQQAERLEKLRNPKPSQSVVIIDEIDKAPRDFPNDLLHEMENLRFRVPELGGLETPAIESGLQPIIIITTNSERQLPDAFLRRCAYVHIEYPRGKALESILASRLAGVFEASSPFLADAQKFYEDLRAKQIIDKPPGTAELLQFMQAMAANGVDQTQPIGAQVELVQQGVALLGKIKTDQERILTALADWAKTAD